MGLLISKVNSGKQTLLLFSSPFSESSESSIKILASYVIDSPAGSSIIDRHGTIWIAYTNGSYSMLTFDY
jgi:hypothetical protein